MHYNGSNSFLFINTTKIYQFKAKDCEIKKCSLCLGNISGDLSVNNMKKNKTRLNKYVCHFSVDYRAFNTSNINIHKYLMKKKQDKK